MTAHVAGHCLATRSLYTFQAEWDGEWYQHPGDILTELVVDQTDWPGRYACLGLLTLNVALSLQSDYSTARLSNLCTLSTNASYAIRSSSYSNSSCSSSSPSVPMSMPASLGSENEEARERFGV